MRTPLLLLFVSLAGCDKPEPKVDASIVVIDAPPTDAAVDAAPDAPPDAPSMNVMQACMHACDALAACFGEQPDPDCYNECAADLADCTAQQVMEIDACTMQPCGDDPESGPMVTCIVAVACVNGATGTTRWSPDSSQ